MDDKFRGKRIEYIDIKTANNILKEIRQTKAVYFEKPELPLGNKAYIEESATKLTITTNITTPCTYIVRIDDDNVPMQPVAGLQAYTAFARSWSKQAGYKIPTFSRAAGSARALLAYRQETDRQRAPAWGYDKRSAYGWAMCQQMPDTRVDPDMLRVVRDGEIGFSLEQPEELPGFVYDDSETLVMHLPGEFADYVFPAIDSPMTEWAQHCYELKEGARTKTEKAKAKAMMIYPVGYLQRTNCWLRAAVVEWANRSIRLDIDNDTIAVNTDSIVSRRERNDIVVGTGLGEYKIEHSGLYAGVGHSYQWNDDIPAIRGVPKAYLKGYDILSDTAPIRRNTYYLDYNTLQIKRRRDNG